VTIRPDQRYPLTWPAGWKRTPTYLRGHSPFKIESTDRAMRDLMDELGRLGASRVIVSSNLKLRQDGMPYSQQPRTDDEGIAVYFVRKGVDMVLACDKFAKREANMRAITKTIEAIRGIERWGSSDMMERAFTGFTALTNGSTTHWSDVLGVPENASRADIEAAYRRLRSQHHPDRGGDAERFHEIQKAFDEASAA
jgi:hypothetical protein